MPILNDGTEIEYQNNEALLLNTPDINEEIQQLIDINNLDGNEMENKKESSSNVTIELKELKELNLDIDVTENISETSTKNDFSEVPIKRGEPQTFGIIFCGIGFCLCVGCLAFGIYLIIKTLQIKKEENF
jgi:hypothetical protein